MKKYIVEIPITGYVTIEVEAESKEQAIDLAWDKATLEHVEEWELHSKVSEGNLLHAIRHEQEVYEM